MASFSDVLVDLLSDLTLSGIAYFALAAALNQAVRLVTEFLSPDWILPQPAAFDIRYELIVFSIIFLHWSTRFLFRCRGHFGCAWKSLAYILRWLSPLHPEPLKTCPCCWMRTHREPATGIDRQHRHQYKIGRPYPIALMSCLPSPAPTPRGEERCLTFDDSSHIPAVSPVSADEITNEWRDVGNFSDKERKEESLSPAVSPVADESTSGWRDLVYSSDGKRTEDTAGQTD